MIIIALAVCDKKIMRYFELANESHRDTRQMHSEFDRALIAMEGFSGMTYETCPEQVGTCSSCRFACDEHVAHELLIPHARPIRSIHMEGKFFVSRTAKPFLIGAKRVLA